jgi:hypothetical protein
MPSKDAKTKARDSDCKPVAEQEKVYAGGNPGFDERKPTGSDKTAETVHAGVNPHFDERQTGKTKSGSG